MWFQESDTKEGINECLIQVVCDFYGPGEYVVPHQCKYFEPHKTAKAICIHLCSGNDADYCFSKKAISAIIRTDKFQKFLKDYQNES